jgi:benzoyl-CoA reductase/2-hydroxyglutaryl-CoA dehydratase subunit BcrC/BadD/HgdB
VEKAEMISELLKFCDFEDKEIQEEGPRIERAFNRLGITSADVATARERIVRYFGSDLKGLLQVIGIALREITDTMLASEEGKKIIYSSIPNAATDILCSAADHSGGKIHVAYPDVQVVQLLGTLFNKQEHIFKAAETSYLRAGAAHCSLLQTRLGLYILDLIPKPDLMLSMGYLCDATCKTDELLKELYGIPLIYLDSQQDHGKDWNDIFRGVAYFSEEIRESKRMLQEIVGFDITDEMVSATRSARREAAVTATKLVDLVLHTDPAPMNAASLMFMRLLRAQPVNVKHLPKLNAAINLLYNEVQERVRQGFGVVPRGAPRIFYGPVICCDPGITDMMEKLGIAIALTEDAIFQPDGSTAPQIEPIGQGKDFWEVLAYQVLQRSLTSCLPMRISAIKGAFRSGKFDGGIMLFHYSCRYGAGDPMMIKDAVQKEFNLPYMVLEADFFDSRYYNAEQLKTRIEAFAEMVKSQKAATKLKTSKCRKN